MHVATMHTSMPINRRAEDDPEGGNRFTMTRFALPVDDPDLAARVRAAGALVRRNRAEPALGATGVIVSGLGLLPPAVVARVMHGLLRGTDVNLVDRAGLTRPAFRPAGPTAPRGRDLRLCVRRPAGRTMEP